MKNISRKSAKGFTLVELLVVIGIIALLISILLPAMNKAKRAANTLACMANLRSIAQAMQIYATEQRGWILGSPDTTGGFLSSSLYTNNNCPAVCESWDWESPVATIMKANFDVRGSTTARTSRFLFLCNYKPFTCPENDVIVGPWGAKQTVVSVVVPMISYNTAALFMQGSPYFGTTTATGMDYHPKINKVGNPSLKIFMADGGLYHLGAPPNYNLDFNCTLAANDYSDIGYMDAYSYALPYDKNATPPTTSYIYSMRHGARVPGRPASEYRFNAVFFDGHAETLDGRSGINPRLWGPKGASVAQPGQEFSPNAINFYNIDISKPYVFPQ